MNFTIESWAWQIPYVLIPLAYFAPMGLRVLLGMWRRR